MHSVQAAPNPPSALFPSQLVSLHVHHLKRSLLFTLTTLLEKTSDRTTTRLLKIQMPLLPTIPSQIIPSRLNKATFTIMAWLRMACHPTPATFQQLLSKPNQSQRSPQLPQYRPRDNHGRNGGRQAPAAYQGEDEHPRRPDAERLFEEFLHDEAIYVSEGTWDRFPQGSRLFVGKSDNTSSCQNEQTYQS